MQGWFDALLAKQGGGAAAAAAAAAAPVALLSVDVARGEFVAQEHFGVCNPGKLFDDAVAKLTLVAKRGALNFDEFVVVFSRFEYE